jgi:hypothetical protein
MFGGVCGQQLEGSLAAAARREPDLFAHWAAGVKPTGMGSGSRVSREAYAPVLREPGGCDSPGLLTSGAWARQTFGARRLDRSSIDCYIAQESRCSIRLIWEEQSCAGSSFRPSWPPLCSC